MTISTRFTELMGIRHSIVQGGMMWVSGRNPFEPGGQGFESLRAHFLSTKFFGCAGHEDGADRTPDGQQDGSTTRRRAGLDVAASATVRSEAPDPGYGRLSGGVRGACFGTIGPVVDLHQVL